MNLLEIKETYGSCKECPGMAGGPVLFEGKESPLLIMAEALGEHEVRSGRPLIGPSGQLFNRILKAANIDRSSAFLCNTCACRPPNNKITAPMIKRCAKIRESLVTACDPKVILAMGATALRALIPKEKGSITVIRGRTMKRGNITVIPTLHPSFIMRQEQETGNDYYGRRVLNSLKNKVLADFVLARKLALNGTPRDPKNDGGINDGKTIAVDTERPSS